MSLLSQVGYIYFLNHCLLKNLCFEMYLFSLYTFKTFHFRRVMNFISSWPDFTLDNFVFQKEIAYQHKFQSFPIWMTRTNEPKQRTNYLLYENYLDFFVVFCIFNSNTVLIYEFSPTSCSSRLSFSINDTLIIPSTIFTFPFSYPSLPSFVKFWQSFL